MSRFMIGRTSRSPGRFCAHDAGNSAQIMSKPRQARHPRGRPTTREQVKCGIRPRQQPGGYPDPPPNPGVNPRIHLTPGEVNPRIHLTPGEVKPRIHLTPGEVNPRIHHDPGRTGHWRYRWLSHYHGDHPRRRQPRTPGNTVHFPALPRNDNPGTRWCSSRYPHQAQAAWPGARPVPPAFRRPQAP